MQLLQLLPKELRSSHNKAKEILTESAEKVNEVEGMLNYAKVYANNQEYHKAQYVIDTFMKLHSNLSGSIAELQQQRMNIYSYKKPMLRVLAFLNSLKIPSKDAKERPCFVINSDLTDVPKWVGLSI